MVRSSKSGHPCLPPSGLVAPVFASSVGSLGFGYYLSYPLCGQHLWRCSNLYKTCCGRPAVAILEKSGLVCCKVRASKRPSPRLPLPCYGCGKPSVTLNKFGPVCGNPCPELGRLQKERGKKTMTERYGDASPALHTRWHVNRGQTNSDCHLCNPLELLDIQTLQ